MDESDIDRWVCQAVAGDPISLEKLLFHSLPEIRDLVYSRLPAELRVKVDIDDVLQLTLTQIFLKLNTLTGRNGRAFLAWVATVAEHQIADCLRHAQRLKRGGGRRQISTQTPGEQSWIESLLADESTASTKLSREETYHALHVALAELPADHHRVLRLFYLEGQSLQQVGAAMGRSSGATRGLLERARRQLRISLERMAGDERAP